MQFEQLFFYYLFVCLVDFKWMVMTQIIFILGNLRVDSQFFIGPMNFMEQHNAHSLYYSDWFGLWFFFLLLNWTNRIQEEEREKKTKSNKLGLIDTSCITFNWFICICFECDEYEKQQRKQKKNKKRNWMCINSKQLKFVGCSWVLHMSLANWTAHNKCICEYVNMSIAFRLWNDPKLRTTIIALIGL